MPPRRSNVSAVSTAGDEETPTREQKDGVNIEDLSLPRTMVQRLAKGVLPPNTQITKDAVLAMQKGATVFVNYLAQAANATTQTNNRRTIPPPAVLNALQELEFNFMHDWVTRELNKFNDTNTGKRNEYRKKLKDEEMSKKQLEGDGEGGILNEQGNDAANSDGERASKRARIADGEELEDEEGDLRSTNGNREGHVGGVNGGDGVDEDEVIDLERDEVIDVDQDEEEGGNEEEEAQQEQEEEEDEEEEDDEDAFPDEGRRLSSVEADEMLSDRDLGLQGASGDEEMSDEGSD